MHRRVLPIGAALLGVVGAARCLAAQAPVVRDSAHVRIVEYAGEAPAGGLSLSPSPLFQHGGGVTDYPFHRVWAGALQPDGGAVVVDTGNQEVIALGPDGTLRGVLAPAGQGPGEVGAVMSVTVLGQDSILIEDDSNAKLLLLTRGSVAKTIRTADFSASYGLRVLGVDQGGSALLGTAAFHPGFTGSWLLGHMARMDLRSGVIDTVGSYEFIRAAAPGRSAPFPPTGFLTVAGTHFVYGRSDRAELVWRDSDGRAVQVLRWNPARLRANREHIAQFERRLLSDVRRTNPSMSEGVAEGMARQRLAEYDLESPVPVPIWSALKGDRDGRTWLACFDGGGEMGGALAYVVIRPDGRFGGSIETPRGFRVLDAGYGRVLGVVADEFDTELVVAYRLQAGGPRARKKGEEAVCGSA